MKILELQPIDMGLCYKCEKTVYAAEGQVVPMFRKIAKSKRTGKVAEDTVYPVHDECKQKMINEKLGITS